MSGLREQNASLKETIKELESQLDCHACVVSDQIIDAKDARIKELEAAIREAYEVYAGSDGFIPQTAPEAYQKRLIEQMAEILGRALAQQEVSKELFDDPEFWVALGKDDEMLRSMGAYDDEPEGRIAELKKDQRRLEFMIEHYAKLGRAMDDRYHVYVSEYEGPPDSGRDSWRDAIDDAMAQQEGGD